MTRSGNAFRDQTGERFGQLVALRRVEDAVTAAGQPEVQYLAACDCGVEIVVRARYLTQGRRTSCGHDKSVSRSYSACHRRVRRVLGAASLHRCVDCGQQAEQWSYDHDDPEEVTGTIIGWHGQPQLCSWSADPAHYQPRCFADHTSFDRTHERRAA